MSRFLNISFEFYPPKTAEGLQHLNEAAFSLQAFSPTFYSVTFGAGGAAQAGTFEIVSMLQQKTNREIVPHISCIQLTKNEIAQLLNRYQALGIRRMVALRGDIISDVKQAGELTAIPAKNCGKAFCLDASREINSRLHQKGENRGSPPLETPIAKCSAGTAGELKYASELVQWVRELTGEKFHIEVAAYPEMHPESASAFQDVKNLKRKYEAGANSAITQYFFNPDAYFYFLEMCAKEKINMPIVPGIMPILNFNKLLHFSKTCGAEMPRWLCKRLEAYGDDQQSIQQFGIEVVSQLCERLIAGGATGLHFYTLNHAELCERILAQLGLGATNVAKHR